MLQSPFVYYRGTAAVMAHALDVVAREAQQGTAIPLNQEGRSEADE